MKNLQSNNEMGSIPYQTIQSSTEKMEKITNAQDLFAKYERELQMYEFDSHADTNIVEGRIVAFNYKSLALEGKHMESLYRFIYPHYEELRRSLVNYSREKVPAEILDKVYSIAAMLKQFEQWFEENEYFGKADEEE